MGGLFIVIMVIAALVVDPSLIVTDQVRQALLEVILSLLQYVLIYGATLIEDMVPALWGQERCATVGIGGLETPSRSEEETSKAGVLVSFMNRNDFDLNEQPPEHEQLEQEQPRVEQQPRPSVDFHSNISDISLEGVQRILWNAYLSQEIPPQKSSGDTRHQWCKQRRFL